MRSNLSWLVFGLIGFQSFSLPLAQGAPPVATRQWQESFDGNSFQMEFKNSRFEFQGPGFHRSLPVHACNEKLISNFFSNFDRAKKNDHRLPHGLLGPRSIQLRTGSLDRKIGRATPFGRWLLKSPSEANELFAQSNLICKKLGPNSGRNPAHVANPIFAAEQAQDVQTQIDYFGSGTTGPACDTCSGAVPTLAACAKRICRQDPSEPYAAQILEQLTQSPSESLWRKIQPKLEEWKAAKLKDLQWESLALENLARSSDTSISPEYRYFQTFMLVAGNSSKAVIKDNNVSFVNWDQLEIDTDKTLANFPNLSDEDRKWLPNAFQEFYRLPMFRDSAMIGQRSVASIYEEKYPGLSLQEALKKHASETESAYNTVREKSLRTLHFPEGVFDDIYPKRLIQAIEKGEVPDEASIEAFFSQAAMVTGINQVLEHPESYPWIKARKTTDLSMFLKSGKVLEHVHQFNEFLKNEGALGAAITQIYNQCLANYSMNMNGLPSQKDLVGARDIFSDVKNHVSDRFLGKLSTRSAALLREKLNGVEAYLPSTSEEFDDDFFEGLKTETESAKTQLKSVTELAANRPESFKEFLLPNIYDLASDDWTPESHLQKNEMNYCKDRELATLNDRAQMTDHVFWVGWLSIKSPKVGKVVMAHELGHLMESYLKNEKISDESRENFQKAETCLTDLHPNDKFLAEDFADLVSGISYPEYNVGCGLLGFQKQDAPDALSVVNSDDDDTHSSDFFRLLHIEQIHQGKLPQLCTDALNAKEPKVNFKSCL